jgi:hypothetical protein
MAGGALGGPGGFVLPLIKVLGPPPGAATAGGTPLPKGWADKLVF